MAIYKKPNDKYRHNSCFTHSNATYASSGIFFGAPAACAAITACAE